MHAWHSVTLCVTSGLCHATWMTMMRCSSLQHCRAAHQELSHQLSAAASCLQLRLGKQFWPPAWQRLSAGVVKEIEPMCCLQGAAQDKWKVSTRVPRLLLSIASCYQMPQRQLDASVYCGLCTLQLLVTTVLTEFYNPYPACLAGQNTHVLG